MSNEEKTQRFGSVVGIGLVHALEDEVADVTHVLLHVGRSEAACRVVDLENVVLSFLAVNGVLRIHATSTSHAHGYVSDKRSMYACAGKRGDDGKRERERKSVRR